MLDLACLGSSFALAGADDIVSNPQPGADAPGYFLTPLPQLHGVFQQPRCHRIPIPTEFPRIPIDYK